MVVWPVQESTAVVAVQVVGPGIVVPGKVLVLMSMTPIQRLGTVILWEAMGRDCVEFMNWWTQLPIIAQNPDAAILANAHVILLQSERRDTRIPYFQH